jgi:hypothetical protein
MHTRQSSGGAPAWSRDAGQQQHRQPPAQLPAHPPLSQRPRRQRRQRCQTDIVTAASSSNGTVPSGNGAVLTAAPPHEAARPQGGLGELAAIPPVLMQWLLRLAHIMCANCSALYCILARHDMFRNPCCQLTSYETHLQEIGCTALCRCKSEGVHSDVALEQSAVGIGLWKVLEEHTRCT